MTETRPRTRAECPETFPCPWVNCEFHLLEVRLDASDEENLKALDEIEETCALDVIESSVCIGEAACSLISFGVAPERATEIVREVSGAKR